MASHMCDGNVPISLVHQLISNHENLETILAKEENLESLEVQLTYLKYLIIQHKRPKVKVPFDNILEQVTSQNIDVICKILRVGIDVHDSVPCINWRNFDDKLIQMKLLNLSFHIEDEKVLEQVLTDLLDSAYHNKSHSNYFLVNILPLYFERIGEEITVEIIWKDALKKTYLEVICGAFPYITSLKLLNKTDYWLILQEQFLKNTNFKVAMYLLRVTLDKLRRYEEFDNEFFKFNAENKESFFQAFSSFCILCDASCEKQLHLIQPSLPMLQNLKIMHPSWLHVVYSLLLQHPHHAVPMWTSIIIFRSDNNFDQYFMETLKHLLHACNKVESSDLMKIMHIELSNFSSKLKTEQYNSLLRQSVQVKWIPAACYNFYRSVRFKKQIIDYNILLHVIRIAKQLPNKYIRRGLLDLIYKKIHYDVTQTEMKMQKLVDILLEFIMDENYVNYALQIIESKVKVDESMLEIFASWMHEIHPNVNKIDLIVATINNTSTPISECWITQNICIPFKERRLLYPVLDRLSNVYKIRTRDIENYLLHRLNIPETTTKICLIDKCSDKLINKCETNLTSPNQSHYLSFEILFYSNETRFRNIYQHWIGKVLLKRDKIDFHCALGFVKLLAKIPYNYMKFIKFSNVLQVYEEFLLNQSNEVALRIFQNLDFTFEHISTENQDFIAACFLKLNELKGNEHFECAARAFIRSVAIARDKMNEQIFIYIMKELYTMSKCSEVILHNCMLYFKYLNICVDVFPMHEFVLYGDIYGKEDRLDYEACMDIYKNCNSPNPMFRPAEIRKWAVESILNSNDGSKIRKVFRWLMEKYKTNYQRRYFPDSTLHLQKLRIMQTLAFMTRTLVPVEKDELISLISDSFCSESHQASVRQLMQFILLQLLKDESNFLGRIVNTIENTSKTQPSTLTGFIPVLFGMEVLKNDVNCSMSIIETMLPWTMGAHFKLRLYSQLVISKISRRNSSHHKFKRKYDTLHKSLESVLNSTKQIDDSIKNDLDLISFVNEHKPHLNYKSLVYLISVYIPKTTGVAATEWEYFDSKHVKQISSEPVKMLKLEEVDVVQKKIIPWRESIESCKARNDLILVTSLIDSSANLGGLARTCEVFGIKQMVVYSSKVVNEKEFQNLSMSGERWLDLMEVKVDDLKEFIVKAKEAGYTALGAEQTSESVKLHKYEFKKKTLILLGNERSGISPNLIPILDACVEIPQFGVVRSLNVHVAGAMFIWEYTRQHMMK